jgi:hypothetical protein
VKTVELAPAEAEIVCVAFHGVVEFNPEITAAEGVSYLSPRGF